MVYAQISFASYCVKCSDLVFNSMQFVDYEVSIEMHWIIAS